MANNKRIAKNTLLLYVRNILILFVSLFTVRVVLDTLGAEDYGLYSVVGGVVTLFSFLKGTMASGSQRFFSFALGEEDKEKLNKIFSVNIFIYLFIAIVAGLLLETIGVWYVQNRLVVPEGRMDSVIFLFHFAVLTFVISIFSAPFMAVIIAHEDMKYYAYVAIVEAFMKLGVVYLLVYFPYDKLQLYGVLLFVASFLTTSIYIVICLIKYSECQFRKFYWDAALLREIVDFTGWSLFGQISTISRSQAMTIFINQAFSPITVAARAIATNISGRVNMFSNNFNMGLYPPIIKSYSSNDKEGMFKLIYNGSKITFFLMWVFALPLFLEMDLVLELWLKNPPAETVLFTRLALIEALIVSLGQPIATAARAAGKMKKYELTLGSLQILMFGVAWVVVRLGAPAYSIYIVIIFITSIMFLVRLFIVRGLIGLKIQTYISKVCYPILGVIAISILPSLFVLYFVPDGFYFSLLNIFISVSVSCIAMYYIGLSKEWQDKVRGMVIGRLR